MTLSSSRGSLSSAFATAAAAASNAPATHARFFDTSGARLATAVANLRPAVCTHLWHVKLATLG